MHDEAVLRTMIESKDQSKSKEKLLTKIPPSLLGEKHARYYERIERNLEDMEKRMGLKRVIRR